MMLLGGLDVGGGGQRLFALVGGVVVGLLELVFLVLVLVLVVFVFWLLVLRVGIEQRRGERHGWRRRCQRISRCGGELGAGDGDCDNARFDGDQSELLLLRHRPRLDRGT
jgi:hypothetical protein